MKAKNEILLKLHLSSVKNETGVLILVKGDAGAGNGFDEFLIDDLLNSEDTQMIRENNDINLVVNHDDQLSVYQEIEKNWNGRVDQILMFVMKPTQF